MDLTCDFHSHLAFDIILPPNEGANLFRRLTSCRQPVRCHCVITLPPFSPIPERGGLYLGSHLSIGPGQSINELWHHTGPTKSATGPGLITLSANHDPGTTLISSVPL